MADEKIVFKVTVADYDKAIKEWEQLRDKVADTTQEYQEAQKEIESLKRAKAELTGETIKSNKAFKKETQAQRESTSEYKKRKKDLEIAFDKQQKFNDVVGTSSVLSFKNSINATKKEISALIELRNTLDITGDEFVVVSNKIALLEQRLKTSSKGNSGSLGTFSKELNGVSKASGGATAAAMELGRVVSDAPYGIRGMANNVSQLASQLFYMAGQQVTATTATNTDTVAKGVNTTATVVATGATVGFAGALRMMWSALMGPMGVLLGIQAVISGLDFFYGANQKAQKSVSDLTKEVYANALVAKQYVKELEDVNLTEERRKVVTQEVLDLIPTLKKEDLEYGKNLDKVRLKIKQYTLAQAARLEVEKLVNQNSALLSKQMRVDLVNSTEDQEEKVKIIKGLLKEEGIELEKAVNQSYQMGQANLTLRKKTNDELIQDFKDLSKKIKKESKPILEQIDNLSQGLALDPSKNGDDKGKPKLLEFEPFDETAERYEDELSKLNEQTELLDAKSEVEKLEIKKKYHLARLEAQHTEHTEKYEQTAAEYRADLELFFNQQIELGKMTQEDADKRLAIFDSNTKTQIRKSEESFGVLMDITKSYYNNRITEANFAGQKLIGDGKTQAQKEQEDLIKHLKSKADLYKSYSDKVKDVLSTIGDFVSAEFERELVVEENRNNEANTLLNNRLLNENLSKDQRADIQNQIAQNDEKLRRKKEQIARKQFNVEKAFKIGMAIADTASSALKAYSSQLSPFDLTSPIRALAAAKVATAFGLANVAMIARTKFQSSPPSTPANASLGSSGGTTERAEPSFNVVGGSRENQLLTAIQSQFDKPLKAYVVSTEVTDQQQLDSVIVNTAGT